MNLTFKSKTQKKSPSRKQKQKQNPHQENPRIRKKKKHPNEKRTEEIYIKSGIVVFLGFGGQQTVSLIEIHQTSVRYKPIPLKPINKKTLIVWNIKHDKKMKNSSAKKLSK